jgi:hypothetical protein
MEENERCGWPGRIVTEGFDGDRDVVCDRPALHDGEHALFFRPTGTGY